MSAQQRAQDVQRQAQEAGQQAKQSVKQYTSEAQDRAQPYLDEAQRKAQPYLDKAQPYVDDAQRKIKYYQERTLVSQLVRYSLLIESTVLTLWGGYHFLMPQQAAQQAFPSTLTSWPHYQVALQSAGAMAVLFASALCTLSFYPQPHTARSLGSGHLLSGAMLSYVHHAWTNTKGLEQGPATYYMVVLIVLQFVQGVFLLGTSSFLPEIPRSEAVEARQKKTA